MRYYIIAGEASGDLHGSDLVAAIRESDPDARIRAWGGDLMAEAGAQVVKHYKDLAFMGFAEVVTHLGTILRNIKWCKEDILQFSPDAIIFIDYPGFNLRIAKWAKKQGFRNFYFIAPQIWAWNTSRAKHMRQNLEQLYAILPFEKAFYADHGMDVAFVGHPLKDRIGRYRPDPDSSLDIAPEGSRILALLPGSRKQEIRTLLPVMAKAAMMMEDYEPVIAIAPSQDEKLYHDILDQAGVPIKVFKFVSGRTYDLLSSSTLAIVTSGTATLETALFKVPQVVVYKASKLSYWIAKKVIRVKFISLVNLILDKSAVPELIQHECTPKKIASALNTLKEGKQGRSEMLTNYQMLWDRLGPSNSARSAGKDIVNRIIKSGLS